MRGNSYRFGYTRPRKRSRKPLFLVLLLLAAGSFLAWKFLLPTPVERAVNNLRFDESVTEAERETIRQAVTDQQKSFRGTVEVSVRTSTEPDTSLVLSAFLPVTGFYSPRQSIASADHSELISGLPGSAAAANDIPEDAVAFIPAEQLNSQLKLLAMDGHYYLDSFNRGAAFRQAVFTGDGAEALAGLSLNGLSGKDQLLKVNQTGVTALTRQMMLKLRNVSGPTYFSEHIGEFLADADITHVSNEVSFQEGCAYSHTLFCSPPEMIETLKASGVDVVELTGNHNNDVGASYNADTIRLYHSLGWGTFGGGLNTAEAAKPWTTEQKGTKLAFLGYNYPDSPNGGAIAGPDKAGANSFNFDRIKLDIDGAKNEGRFVIVDVQFWECYAYPEGYLEFPECDMPIPNQAEVFRRIIDLGADMVVGSSAHQPQTYEIYKDKPIYYGLGNLYFDQDRWPGTERGIILTHYFSDGKLIQTKLTPTEYGSEYQTRQMNSEKAEWLLDRLNTARGRASL